MNLNLWGIVASFAFIFVILFASRFMSRFGVEASRKFIHIVLANWWILAMVFFDNWLFAAIVPFIFIVLNFLSYRYGIFKTMERGGGKEDLGTVYYAISLFVLAIFSFQNPSTHYIGAVGIFVMGYGDGFAAIVGKSTRFVPYTLLGQTKSLGGSLTMFGASFIALMLLLLIQGRPEFFIAALTVALFASIVEGVTPFGLDNLTVPILSSFMYYFLFF